MGEFKRYKSIDDVELCGIYCKCENSKKVIIHTHGMGGNFYENRFVSDMEHLYLEKGYSFVSFNNRGHDYFSDLLLGESKTIKGGSAYELFEDCVLDIEGVILSLKDIGYEEFILSAHSFGCNKIVYSYNLLKDKYNITSLILLAPCDIYKQLSFMIKNYDDYILENKMQVLDNNYYSFVPNGLFPLEFTAKTVYNNFSKNSNADIFKYREIGYKSELLNSVNIPVHIFIGLKDECVFTNKKEFIEKFLKDNFSCCDINYIDNAKHIFKGYEKKLIESIGSVL